jgi:hypothetical protein
MCETMFFFQCPGMCQPLDSAMPGRPLSLPFWGQERYAFMFLCEKNCACGHGLSTAEAEYIAMSSALREVIPLMTLMKELHNIFPVHINKPKFVCKVHEDNQSTIKMATSDKFIPLTKHIALKYHNFFCSHVKNGHIEINYCPTEDQKADLLTNPLADAAFFRLRHMLIG